MQEEIMWGLVHSTLLFSAIFFRNQFQPPISFYTLLSITILVVGVIVFIISWKELGEFRIGIYPGKVLVTTGIYSKIRNPIYLGIKIIYLGFALYFRSIISIILVIIILVPVHIFRARKEEQELIKKFGERYKEYKKKTIF